MRGLLSDVEDVDNTEASGEKRLVAVAPGGVHDQATRITTYGLGECLGTLLDDDLAPADFAGDGDVDGRDIGVNLTGNLAVEGDHVQQSNTRAHLGLD